jgi:hypothetical protein
MKNNKPVIAAMLIGMVSSCNTKPTTVTKETEHVISLDGVRGITLKVVEVEGCEYLVGGYDRSGLLTHKGNCKNPIHPEHTRR